MKIEIKVPSAGESVTEATVSRIIRESGSTVKTDEEILELETDKVNQVVFSPGSGILTLKVKQGDVVHPGESMGYVDSEAKAARTEQSPPPKPQKPAPSSLSEPVESTESARRSVEQFAEETKRGRAPSPAKEKVQENVRPAADEKDLVRKPMSRLRRTIADRMVAVKNQTAMLTTFNEADLTAIMAIRAKEQGSFSKKYGVKLGYMSFFVKAVVAALKAYPEVNSRIDGSDIVTSLTYDMGIAVSTDRGLLVPVIRGCDRLSFGEIEKAIADAAKSAREGKISIDALKGGSFTITNAGSFGSLLSTPILNPPQSAILGMHAIQKRAVVVGDQIMVRSMMYLALSYDHRIIDGKEAVQFLVHIKNSLEEPSRILLDL